MEYQNKFCYLSDRPADRFPKSPVLSNYGSLVQVGRTCMKPRIAGGCV